MIASTDEVFCLIELAEGIDVDAARKVKDII